LVSGKTISVDLEYDVCVSDTAPRSVFGGGSVIWLICPNPSVICFAYYLKFLTLFVVFIGGWLRYEIVYLFWAINCFLYIFYNASSFSVSIRFIPFFLLMAFLLVLWRLVIG